MNEIIEKDFKEFFNNEGRKKEYIGDLITIKARNLKNCTLQINRSIRVNIVPDPEYGAIRTRFRTSYYGEYKIAIGDMRDFDTLFVLGINKDKEIIETAYAIPEKVLEGKRYITINTKKGIYHKFRIDEKPYNKIYNYMKKGDYSIFEDNNIVIHKTGSISGLII